MAQVLMDEQARINQEILDVMTGEAEGAVHEGSKPSLREVVSKGEDEFAAPMVAKIYEDAGVIAVYDTVTGDRSFCNRNMAPALLRKRREDGSRQFSRFPPTDAAGNIITPKGGHLKCLLHPDERLPEYDEWGLATCRKPNLVNPLHRDLHMQHCHRTAWKMIQKYREDQEKKADRERQEQILLTLAARVGEGSEERRRKTG